MNKLLIAAAFLLLGTPAFAGSCLPGTLQDYVNLGENGCTQNGVLLTDSRWRRSYPAPWNAIRARFK